ncbi:MAG: hypothetical protein ABI678_10155, partial [Kofleriaceae bacterium]
MKRLALLALLPSCATMWITTQATGTAHEWDEQIEERRVPQPGFTEHLEVRMPLVTEYQQIPGAAGQPMQRGDALPFHFACESGQHGEDRVYRHGYRYGKKWKIGTAISVLVEGGLGALGLLTATQEHPFGYVYGTFFALDAAVALPLLFIPKKEVFRTTSEPNDQALTRVCPEGLTIFVAGQPYPIDAIGKVSAAAETALDAWMREPRGALELSYAGQARELPLGGNEQCAWLRDRSPTTRCGAAGALLPESTRVTFGVAP